MDNINDAIANAYFDENGFRGVQDTYKKAKADNPEVTLEHVKDSFERAVSKKKNLKGYNSYVANKPKQEYQADLFFLTSMLTRHSSIFGDLILLPGMAVR